MEFHGIPWTSMEFHGTPWSSMGFPWMIHGTPWNSMEFHGGSMEFHGGSMEFHGDSMELHGVPWRSMEPPWNCMDFHGTSLELHGRINIPCKVIMHGQCLFHKNQRKLMIALLIKNITFSNWHIYHYQLQFHKNPMKYSWKTHESFSGPWILHFPFFMASLKPINFFMKIISWLVKKRFLMAMKSWWWSKTQN